MVPELDKDKYFKKCKEYSDWLQSKVQSEDTTSESCIGDILKEFTRLTKSSDVIGLLAFFETISTVAVMLGKSDYSRMKLETMILRKISGDDVSLH